MDRDKVQAMTLAFTGVLLGLVLCYSAASLLPSATDWLLDRAGLAVTSIAVTGVYFVGFFLSVSFCSTLGLLGIVLSDRITYGAWTAPQESKQ